MGVKFDCCFCSRNQEDSDSGISKIWEGLGLSHYTFEEFEKKSFSYIDEISNSKSKKVSINV